jgi:4a-hydroxytetrahydrobiopterin dehydratase
MADRVVAGEWTAGESPCDLPLDRPGRYVLGMTDGITPRQFYEAKGVADWLVLVEGAEAFFRTGSFAASVRFVAAIGQLGDVDDHPPEVDVRGDGVTVRLITRADDWYGVSASDVELARQISAVARDQSLFADPSAIQTLLLVPGAPVGAEIMPFWRAVLGYEPRADSPDEDLVDPHHRGVSFWFETMDQPRSDGGGAIHIGVWVAPDQAEARVAAALAAGGRLVRDEFAPSWWTLADAAGNEADISTTIGRG